MTFASDQGGFGDSNSVEIVIQAQDLASDVIQNLGTGLSLVAASAGTAQVKIAALGVSLLAVGGLGVRATGQLSGGLGRIRSIIESPISRTIFTRLKAQAEDALTEIQPLTDVLSSLAGAAQITGKGLLGLPDVADLRAFENKFTPVVGKISALFSRTILSIPIAPELQGILPAIEQKLTGSDVFKSLEIQLADALNTGFYNVLSGANRIVAQTSFTLGSSIGYGIVQGMSPEIAAGFSTLDTILGSSLSGFIEQTLPGLSSDIVQNSGVLQLISSSIGELTGGTIEQGISQILGTRTSGEISELGRELANVTGLTKIAGLGLTRLLTTVVGRGIKRLSGTAVIQLSDFIDSRIPEQVKTIFSRLESVFPQQFALLRKLAQSGATSLTGNIFKSLEKLNLSPTSRIQAEITRLTRVATNEQSESFKQLAIQSEETFKRQANSVRGATASIRQEIAANQDRILQSTNAADRVDAQKRVAYLQRELAGVIQENKSRVAEIRNLERIRSRTSVDPFVQFAAQEEVDSLTVALPQLEGLEKYRSEIEQSNLPLREQSVILASIDAQIVAITNQYQLFASTPIQRIGQVLAEIVGLDFSNLDAITNAAKVVSDILGGVGKLVQTITVELVNSFFEIGGQSAVSFVQGLSGTVVSGLAPLVGYITNLASTTINRIQQLAATTGQKIAEVTENIGLRAAFTDIVNDFSHIVVAGLSQIGVTAGSGFSSGLNQGFFAGLAPVVNTIDTFVLNVVARLQRIPDRISTALGAVADTGGYLAGIGEPVEVFDAISNGAESAISTLNDVGQRMFFIQSAMQTLQLAVQGGPFALLIGQNIKLQEQLISTQASLVGTNRIIGDITGKEITDPEQAINALKVPVEAAISRIRKGSLELVGVTSGQLIDSFQIVAGQIGEIGISLDQGADLTLSFAAALGTLGIPLEQARQEITSIVQGTVDQNSIIAKTLNLTNQQIAQYKSQGILFEQLTKRFDAYRAGNKIAADSVGGFTSNIQDVVELIGLIAGKPLLAPIIKELQVVYEYLLTNQAALTETVAVLSSEVLSGVVVFVNGVKGLFGSLQDLAGQIPTYLIKSFVGALKAAAGAIAFTVQALQPAINLLAKLAEFVYQLGGPFLELFFQFKALQIGIGFLTGSFGILVKILPFVGDLLFFLQLRMIPMIQLMPLLSGQLGLGAAGFLLIGRNMAAIPGLALLVTRSLGAFGPLAPVIVSLIAPLAGVGITLAGLAASSSAIAGVFAAIAAGIPAMLVGLAGFASTTPFLATLAPALLSGATSMASFTAGTTLAAAITAKFKQLIGLALVALRGFVISLTFTAAAAYAAFYALDQFVLKNQELMEVLGGVLQGLGLFKDILFSAFTHPLTIALGVILAITLAIKLKLIPQIIDLIRVNTAGALLSLATQLAGPDGLVGTMGGLARILNGLGLVGMAAGATQGAAGLRALKAAAIPAAVALRAIYTAVATGGLSTLPAAITANATALTAFGVALKGIALGLVALAGPILIVTAALATVGLLVRTFQLRDSQEAFDIYSASTDRVSDSTIKLATKLKAAKDRQAAATEKGIALTKAEYKANDLLLKQVPQQIATLDDQINTLKAALVVAPGEKGGLVGKELIEGTKTEILALESLRTKLLGLGSSVSNKAKLLPQLGSELEQLANTARDTEKAVVASAGEPEVFKKRAEELIAVTQLEQKYGVVTAAEVKRRLELIATNAGAEYQLQAKAQEAITEAYKLEGEKRIAILTADRSVIEANIEAGRISEIEGDRQLTASKNKELQIQLANLVAAKDAEAAIRGTGLKQTLKVLEDQLAAAKARLPGASVAPDNPIAVVKDLSAQKDIATEAVASLEQQLQGMNPGGAGGRKDRPFLIQQKKERDALLAQLDNYRSKLVGIDEKIDAAKEQLYARSPETTALSDEKDTLVKAAADIEKQITGMRGKQQGRGFAPITQEQKKEKTALEQELKDYKKQIDEVNKKIANAKNKVLPVATSDPKALSVLNKEIKAIETAIKKAKDGESSTRKQTAQEKAAEAKKAAAEEEKNNLARNARERKTESDRRNLVLTSLTETENQKLKQQTDIYNILSKAVENRNKALAAGRDLAASATSFLTGGLNALGELSKSDYKKQKLAEATAAVELQALKIKQQYEQESLRLQQEQNRLALERELIENRIAQNNADSEVTKAKNVLSDAKKDPKNIEKPEVIRDAEVKLRTAILLANNLTSLDSLLSRQLIELPGQQVQEQQSLGFKQGAETNDGLIKLFKTLTPGKQAATRADLERIVAGSVGGRNAQDIVNQGQITSRNVQREFGIRSSAVNVMSERDPRLADVAGVASPEDYNKVLQNSAREQYIKYGAYQPNLVESIPAGTQPLQLPGITTQPPVQTVDVPAVTVNVESKIPAPILSAPAVTRAIQDTTPINVRQLPVTPTPEHPIREPLAREVYKTLFAEVARTSGVTPDPNKVPDLVVDDKYLKQIGGADAAYKDAKNQIVITQKLADYLNGGLKGLTSESEKLGVIIHEIRHALQFGLGEISGEDLQKSLNNAGVDLHTGLTKASLQVQDGVNKSLKSASIQAGGKPETADIKVDKALERDAYEFQEKNTANIANSVVQAFKGVGDAGTKIQEFGIQTQQGAVSFIDGIDQFVTSIQKGSSDITASATRYFGKPETITASTDIKEIVPQLKEIVGSLPDGKFKDAAASAIKKAEKTELPSSEITQPGKIVTPDTKPAIISSEIVQPGKIVADVTGTKPAPVQLPTPQPFQTPLTLPSPQTAQVQPLTLPSPDSKSFSVSLTTFSGLFLGGINRLIQTLETTGSVGGSQQITLNAPITVNSVQGGDKAVAQKTGDDVLEALRKVANQGVAIAKARN